MAWRPYNIHKAMKNSAKLFDKSLGLRWCYHGNYVSLLHEGEEIWNSKCGGGRWDQLDSHGIASAMIAYYETPVSKLRKREVNSIGRFFWREGLAYAKIKTLFPILLAADKRLGKNLQSRWLFTEASGPARKLSYLRL